MQTNEQISTIIDIDPIARQSQQLYGGETAVEIYANNLERLARSVRCYGADAGLALLLGRLCVMMEHSPGQAALFAQDVAGCRADMCNGVLRAAARE
jgi:hypothetical protein